MSPAKPEPAWLSAVTTVVVTAAILVHFEGVARVAGWAPHPFLSTPNSVIRRLQYQEFEPGLLFLASAALARFAPPGRARVFAGWAAIGAAVSGVFGVVGSWTADVMLPHTEWHSSDVSRAIGDIATLMIVAFLAWWGTEAIRGSSHQVDAPDLA